MKSLPGLIKHEHEALKAVTLCKYKLSQKSELYMDDYTQYFYFLHRHVLKLFGEYKSTLIL